MNGQLIVSSVTAYSANSMKPCVVIPPRGGTAYEWSADHTFVRVGAEHTEGVYTLMEDNLTSGFALGLDRHDRHAETFYVLEGPIEFFVNDARGPRPTSTMPRGWRR